MSATQEEREYILFTRINRGDDLMEVGSLKAESDELASVYAQYIYNEEDWVEMKVVRKDSIITIREPEPLFKGDEVR